TSRWCPYPGARRLAVGLLGRPPVPFGVGDYPRGHRALFRVELGGAALGELSHLPMKPTSVTVPPFGMTGLKLGLPTVICVPFWLTVAFHSSLMFCPLAKRQRTVQPLMSFGPRLVMRRLTWNSPVQSLSRW